MTGPEHYREAEKWLAHAKGTYLDDSNCPGPRDSYPTEAAWTEALRESAEQHELALREAAVFAALGQAHATLAQAAAYALTQPISSLENTTGHPSQEHYEDWVDVIELTDDTAKGGAASA